VTDSDRDRAEMRALADRFRQLMVRENEVQLFDHETRQRIGEAIGKAMRQSGSDFGYLPQRKG
jgi:hypothetical protein